MVYMISIFKEASQDTTSLNHETDCWYKNILDILLLEHMICDPFVLLFCVSQLRICVHAYIYECSEVSSIDFSTIYFDMLH